MFPVKSDRRDRLGGNPFHDVRTVGPVKTLYYYGHLLAVTCLIHNARTSNLLMREESSWCFQSVPKTRKSPNSQEVSSVPLPVFLGDKQSREGGGVDVGLVGGQNLLLRVGGSWKNRTYSVVLSERFTY
jgi:hypothetical protein